MRLFESKKKIPLPKIFFITNREELEELPIGVPFFYGEESKYDDYLRILEYEVLYQKAVSTGYPFNFKQILKDAGFIDMESYGFGGETFFDFKESDDEYWLTETLEDGGKSLASGDNFSAIKGFLKDETAYVDIEKLKQLNVFPVWLSNIEDAISTNIQNFATHNPMMYNKKLGGMYGGVEMTSPNKSLIIIDISGSIPRAISSTCLMLAKHLSESFYADIMITGSKSTLYTYENIHTLNVETIYEENEMGNDQAVFKSLVTSDVRSYDTAIVFGDEDNPGYAWSNEWNKSTKTITDADGQKLNKWNVKKLIAFHTRRDGELPGYSRWFTPDTTEHIKNWVKYLN